MSHRSTPDVHCAIVGAGFAGIGAAIELDKAGLPDYVIIEAGDGPGGTWYWNTYPGIAVDIPSFSYQFSFEQSSRWSRTYAPGSELRAYAEHCVKKYGLRSRIRFGTKVVDARFNEAGDLWQLALDSGDTMTARYLINASGALTTPKPPEIDGLDRFAGISMHTARWDHTQDLSGKRVAIIGTGASAVQVIPGGVSLARFWDENRLQAYQGVTVPGFPNMFTVFGPYGYVGSSYFALIEAQTHHIIRCLGEGRRRNATRVEISVTANDRYFAEMMRKRHRQIFWQDSCRLANSYYFDKNGDVPLRPASTVEAYWQSRRFPLSDYQFTG